MQLGYVIVYVADVNHVLSFYEKAFGFQVRLRFEENNHVDYGELETGGAILGFASHELGDTNFHGQYQRSSLEQLPFGQELAFVTEDVPAAYQRAVEAGAIALSAPTEKPWGQIVAYVRSIEGTLIELCSPMS